MTWTDKAAFQNKLGWDNAQTTDGIDRPISLTAIVVGGETDNEMIYVSDKRRPDAVLSVDMDEVYTEGALVTFTAHGGFDDDEVTPLNANYFESFQFVDQYGKTITGTKGTAKKFGDSTGFFAAANTDALVSSDTDFKNHLFGVRVTYAGSNKINYEGASLASVEGESVFTDGTGLLDNNKAVIIGNADLVFSTGVDIESAAPGEGFKFAVASINPTDANTEDTHASTWDSVSPDKFVGVTVVDLSQVKSLAIQDLNKFYLGAVTATEGGDATTGAGKVGGNAAGLAELVADGGSTVETIDDAGLQGTKKYKQEVVIKGTYNGKSVTVPAKFFSVKGDKLQGGDGATLGATTINAMVDDGINIQDLYDKTSAQGTAKDAKDTLKASVVNLYTTATTHTNNDIDYKVAKTGDDLAAAKAALEALAADGEEEDTSTAAEIIEAVQSLYDDATIDAGTSLEAAALTLELADNANDAIADYVDGLAWTATPAADPAPGVTAEAKAAAAEGALVAINVNDELAAVTTAPTLFDTVSKEITISDQAPAATTISGLKDAYTIAPTLTALGNDTIEEKIGVTSDPVTVKVLDQYGVDITDPAKLTYRATDLAEASDGYAENNLTANDNDDTTLNLTGAERGDTFTLVLKQDNATAQTVIKVGADTKADISSADGNEYREDLLPELEVQRKNGLG